MTKARELRAQASRAEAALDEPDLRRRLEHYEHSLAMRRSVAAYLPLVHQLTFGLWALRTLPPPRAAG